MADGVRTRNDSIFLTIGTHQTAFLPITTYPRVHQKTTIWRPHWGFVHYVPVGNALQVGFVNPHGIKRQGLCRLRPANEGNDLSAR